MAKMITHNGYRGSMQSEVLSASACMQEGHARSREWSAVGLLGRGSVHVELEETTVPFESLRHRGTGGPYTHMHESAAA